MNWIDGAPKEVLPGMQLEIEGTLYLVGGINFLGGVCDCCTVAHQFERCITRYRVLLTPAQMEAA